MPVHRAQTYGNIFTPTIWHYVCALKTQYFVRIVVVTCVVRRPRWAKARERHDLFFDGVVRTDGSSTSALCRPDNINRARTLNNYIIVLVFFFFLCICCSYRNDFVFAYYRSERPLTFSQRNLNFHTRYACADMLLGCSCCDGADLFFHELHSHLDRGATEHSIPCSRASMDYGPDRDKRCYQPVRSPLSLVYCCFFSPPLFLCIVACATVWAWFGYRHTWHIWRSDLNFERHSDVVGHWPSGPHIGCRTLGERSTFGLWSALGRETKG